MYKGIFIFLIIAILFTANSSVAKIVFKKLDGDIVAYINEHEISLEALKKSKGEQSEHTYGQHGRKSKEVPDRIYLKGIFDNYLLIDHLLSIKFDKGEEYNLKRKQFKEKIIINNYIKAEIYDKIDEEDDQKKRELVSQAVNKMPDDYKGKHQIKVNKELVQKGALAKGFALDDVVARVDDYDISIADVLNKASSSYYDQINPGERISQDSLDSALDDLVRRAVVLKEAHLLGYGKNVPEPNEEEKYVLLEDAYQKKEYQDITVTDKELLEMLDYNKKYYTHRFVLRKFGLIIKRDEEEIRKIKERLDNGEDFYKIAVAESEDELTKATGGIQDYTQKASPAVKDAIVLLKDGEISDVLNISKSIYGIIKRIDILYDEYDELIPIVDDEIRQERLKRIIFNKMIKLREGADIVINENIISEDDFFGSGAVDSGVESTKAD